MNTSAIKRTAAPLRQEVTDALRREIVRSGFSPGQRLTEAVLCEKFEVSRTVIREALRQLEAEGLVAMVPNRGPEVATLTIRDAESLYELRGALESLAGGLFAERASDSQCTALVDCLNEVKASFASGDVEDLLAAKDRFYDVMLTGAGNAEVKRTLRNVNARIQLLRGFSLSSPGRAPLAVAEFTRITAAAAVNRDPVETRKACEEHVRNAADAALTEMRRTLAIAS